MINLWLMSSTAYAMTAADTEDHVGNAAAERAVGYVWGDVEAQLEALEHRLRSWAESNGITLLDVVREVALPADGHLLERPGFKEVLQHLHRMRPALLVVSDLGQLGASPLAWPVTIVMAERLGATLVILEGTPPSMDERVDCSVRDLLAALSQLVDVDHRVPIQARMDEKGALGELRGRRPPYGFVVGPDGRTLVRDEDEQRLIARAVELRMRGLSYQKIGATLEEEGFHPRKAHSWHSTTLRSILLRAGVKG